LVCLGRFAEADVTQRDLEAFTDRFGHPLAAAAGRRNLFAKVAATRADLPLLDELSRKQSRMAQETGNPGWVAYAQTLSGVVEFWRGDWEAAYRNMADGARLAMPGTLYYGLHHGFLMVCEAFSGDRDGPSAVLDTVREVLPTSGQANTLGQWNLAILAAEAMGVLGDRQWTRRLYPLVVDALTTGTVMRLYDGRLIQTVAGVAASAAGLWEEAEEHFESALRQAEELPHLMERPHVRHFYGRFLLERDRSGDGERARILLEEAVAGYHAIGMPRHEAMARDLLTRAQTRHVHG
jgi:hypothetical protein